MRVKPLHALWALAPRVITGHPVHGRIAAFTAIRPGSFDAVGGPSHTEAMKLPRVECPVCGRPIAAGSVAGRLSKGRVWRHDPPGLPHVPGQPLVSCDGSLAIVDLPMAGRQLELGIDQPDVEPQGLAALF